MFQKHKTIYKYKISILNIPKKQAKYCLNTIKSNTFFYSNQSTLIHYSILSKLSIVVTQNSKCFYALPRTSPCQGDLKIYFPRLSEADAECFAPPDTK